MSKSANTNVRLDSLINRIDEQIGVAIDLACDDAVMLLRMSQLALRLKRHDISDDELSAFCDAVSIPAEATGFHDGEAVGDKTSSRNVLLPFVPLQTTGHGARPASMGRRSARRRRAQR